MENNQPKLEKFEVVKCGPYRFIGKSVYARAFGKSDMIFGGLWEKSDWIFKQLGSLKEYASDEIHNTAFMLGNGSTTRTGGNRTCWFSEKQNCLVIPSADS